MLEPELYAFLEGTADAAFTVDEEGQIRSWNASAEKLFGYTASEVLNRACHELLQGRGALGCDGGVRWQHCGGGEQPAFDLEVRVHSGRRIWVNVSTLVYRDTRTSRRLVVHLARDVSERKKREELAGRMLELSRQLVALSDAPRAAPASPLSEQERRIMRSFAKGRNSAEIARDLGISLQTLRNHLYRINQKLRTHNRLEAVMAAIDRRLI